MKRIVTAILFFSFFITSLSAQELGTLQQIKTSGKIKVGYRQFYPSMTCMG